MINKTENLDVCSCGHSKYAHICAQVEIKNCSCEKNDSPKLASILLSNGKRVTIEFTTDKKYDEDKAELETESKGKQDDNSKKQSQLLYKFMTKFLIFESIICLFIYFLLSFTKML